MNDDLKSIVELAISNGYGLNDISSGLAEDGWGQADIDAAVNYYNSKKKSQGKGGASPSTSQPKPTSSEYQQTSTAAPTQLAQTIEWGPTEFRQGLGAGVQGAQEPKRDTEEEKQAARKRTALQERQAIGLDIASILTSDNPDSDDNKQKVSNLYEQYKQADANYAGQEMLYQNIFNNEGSVDQNVYNYVVNDAVASINETAARELEQYKRTGGESVLDRSINTLFAGVESIAGGVAMGVELLKDANNYRLGIPNYGEMSPVGELGSEMLQGSQKTMYSVFRAAGYSDEQIKKGTLGMATEEGDLGMLYYTALQQVPQLALMAVTGGTAGMTTLGLSSAGSAYDELYQDPSYNVSEKLIYGLASGVVEGVSERIFNADVRALRGIFGTADDVAQLSTREFAKKYMPKLTAINDAIPGLAKSTAQEAFEEGLVAVTQESIKYALNEDKQNFDVHDIAESMFVGAVMGGSIHSIAYGPSALLNSRLFVDKYTLRNKIVETQKLLNDPTLSEEEKDILSGQLNDFVRKEREMKDSAAEYYSNWEDSDINETQRLNQVINRGLKTYSKMRSNVAKDKILADVKDAFNAKQEIEKKYDSQTEGQVSGAVQGGETSQQGQPVQGPSAKTTPAGGVLQVSEQAQQASAKVKVKSVKVTNENASKSIDWLKDWVNNLAETGFQFVQTNKQTVLDGLDSIQKVAQFMHNNGRDVNIVTHTDADSYKKATGLENVTRGYYIAEEGNSSQIHVFVPAMLSNTAYHEGIHEVLPEVLGTEGTRRLGRRLWNVIRGDKALLRQMQSFMRNYSEMTETEMADEFLTELGSLIADGSIELEVSKSIATKFMESIAEIMGTAFGVNMKPSTAQLAQALIDLGGAISTGKKVDFEELIKRAEHGDVIASGVSGGVRTSAQNFADIDINFASDELPKGVSIVSVTGKKSMEQALEESGGAFVIINSDGTALRHTSGGEDVYGGFGFSFIEQNVKDKIGFAASTDNKVSELGELLKRVAEERDAENSAHVGKPVAVFVMIQSPGAAFGNAYGAKFFADAISSSINNGVITQEEFKNSFTEFYDKEVARLNNLTNKAEGKDDYEKIKAANDNRIAKLSLINDAIVNNDFNTNEGHDALQALVSSDSKIDFKTRREFLESFVPGKQKVSGAGSAARNAFLEAGFNKDSFFKEYLDKNIYDNITSDTDGGYALSGFFVENPYMGGTEYSRLGKEGKFVHPQFNSKFHGERPFLLDGKYYVNKIFEPQKFEGASVATSVSGSMYVSSAKAKKSNRTDKEQAEAIKEVKSRAVKANKLREFSVTAAPYRQTKIKTVSEAKDAFKGDKGYTDLKNTQSDILKALEPNLAEEIKVFDNVGGWRDTETGDISIETSSRIDGYMSMEDAELLAALSGVLAEDTQNSTLISRISNEGTGLVTTINLDTKAQGKLLDYIKELGLEAGFSFTIESGKNRISFAWNEQIEDWGLSLDQYLDNVEKFFNFVKDKNLTKDERLTTAKAEIRFVSEEEYGRIIEGARNSGRYEGDEWSNLDNIISQAEVKLNEGKKKGKAQEIGPAPESSNLNTYQVSVYLQSNMERSFADFSKNALENLKSGKGVSLHDAETKAGEKGYISTIKVAAESRYRDSSRYFSAYFSSLNTGKKVRVKIRVSDHEIPKNETARLDEYGSGGVYRTSDRRDKESKFSYNIWNRQTFNSAFDHLKTLGFTFPTEIKSEYFTFNRRSQQAINIQNELAELLFVNTTRDKDGNIVIDLSREDFITTANIYGLPEHIAHEMYDKQLEGKLSVEIKGTDAIDATYENYLDATANLIAKATTLYEKLKKYFIDRQSTVKAYLVSAGLDNVRKLLVNRSGASAYAKYLFDKWDILVYKGLDVEAQRMLDKIVFLRRVIQIDEATDGRKRVILNEKAILQGELVAKQHELYLAPQNEYAKILKEIKELEANIAKLQSEADAIVRVQHPKFYGNSSWNKESAYAQLDQIKQKLGQETYDDMFKRSDEYFNAFRELLNSMNKEGLITQEDYDALSSFDYQPRMFVKHVFDNVEDDVALRDYGLSQSQIKALRNGSQSEILMDSRLILSIYSKSVTARIAKNKANRELAKGLKNPRNSDWLLPNPNGEAAQSGFENVYYYDKGEQRVFQMRKDLKQEWDDVSQIFKMSPTLQKIVGYASGSFALKLLATRANPLFVLRNLPRDYFHVLFFTDTYENTPLPVAAFKLIGDFYRGVKSKVTDDADFQDYVRLGGMMDFLSTEGKPSAYKKSTWGRLADRTLEYTSAPGEYSEIGFRIAVYKKMVQNGIAQFEKANKRKPDAGELEMIKSGAVTAAREVIDFSQGGSFTKGAEIVTPYLNSAFQGMRVSWDYIKANPKQFASRLAQMQFGIIALALYNASIGDDEMEDIPDETKKRYFIIMTPFMTEDSKGRKVRRYIKVAKTQQMMPFFAMAEIASDQIISNMFGKKPQFSSDQLKYAVDGIASFFPKDLTKIDKEILSAMPLLSAVTTYTTNYDAFREQVIEKNLGEMLPQTEGLFDKDIPYFYKVIGDLTEMSPKRLQVATEKMITSPYSSALVGGAYALMDVFASPYVIEGKYDKEGGLSMSENFSVKMKTMLPKSFSMGQTNPDWKSYNIAEDIEKINQEEGSNRKQVRELSKRFAKSYRDAETEKERKQVLEDASAKMKEIAKENPLDAKYFKSSFKTAAMVSGHYSPFTNEIVYAASDMARAKIIRRVLVERGGVGREDFIELRKELFKESRYEINSSTMAMYKKLYGNFD